MKKKINIHTVTVILYFEKKSFSFRLNVIYTKIFTHQAQKYIHKIECISYDSAMSDCRITVINVVAKT